MASKHFKTLRNILITFLTLGFPIALILFFGRDIKMIERYIPSSGAVGPLLSVLIMGILSLTPIPTDPIVILNGAIFGPFVGVIVSWLGNTLAAIIEYYIGRGLGQITDFDKQKKKLPFGLGKFPVNSIWFLILGRLVPSFGSKVVSIAGGVYRVPLWRYLWTAMVSNLFGSLLLALGGYSLLHTFAK